MSADPQDQDDTASAPKRKGRGRLLILAAPVVLLAVGAGLWFSGILPGMLGMGDKSKQAKQAEAEAAPKPPTFVDVPELIANINAGGRRTAYIKLKAKLELPRPEDAAPVQAAMPRVVDLFQTYIREMRPEELRGAAGTYRLREELLARVTPAVAPAKVDDVLFTELIVQ